MMRVRPPRAAGQLVPCRLPSRGSGRVNHTLDHLKYFADGFWTFLKDARRDRINIGEDLQVVVGDWRAGQVAQRFAQAQAIRFGEAVHYFCANSRPVFLLQP